MKVNRIFFLIIFYFFFHSNQLYSDNSIDALKGIWSSIKSFPLFSGSFWSGIGHGFGAPPTGYVYSFMVHNDTSVPVWVATQDLASVMGGVFPEASGWDCTQIPAYSAHGQDYKNYYFELFIKTSAKDYSNHMPYLQHDDVLYQIEKIDLIPTDKHSEHRNHFRVYMGKDLVNGSYDYSLKAEYVGYENIVANPKDKNALSINGNLSNLTIKNSTQNDYYIGFTTAQVGNISSLSTCQMVGFLQKDSFGLLSAVGSIKTLRPGTIGIFKDATSESILNMTIPDTGFDNYSYTLEIYQDPKDLNIVCAWQGIMPGHYDMPVNRIKDITPIIGCFWYQSASKQKGLFDLPGTVWIVSIEKISQQKKILGMAQPGQVLLFNIERPNISDIKELYFLYVSESDVTKAQTFVQNFLSEKIGVDTITAYHQNLDTIMQNSALQLNPKIAGQETQNNAPQTSMSHNLINQISSGVSDMQRGQITDPSSGTVGFLLGFDLFFPLGVGASPFYYVLEPSNALNGKKILPTNSVINVMQQAPQKMPTTYVPNTYAPITYAIS